MHVDCDPPEDELDSDGKKFRTVVFEAAGRGNLNRLKAFAGPYKHKKKWVDDCLNNDYVQKYPLVNASRNGHFEIVKFLHEIGAKINVRGSVEFESDYIYGTTPLWAAAAAGHEDIVRYLVEVGFADVNETTDTQSTPLRGACYDGHNEIVEYLLSRGADPNIPNRHGHTCLMIAAYRNKIDVVRSLIKSGVDANMKTSKGNTALHDAAESGNKEIITVLIEAGAKMEKDAHGVTPLLCAAQACSEDTMKYIAGLTESNLEKRDAWKLLGCTYVDKKIDMNKAMKCWKTALSLPLTDDEQAMVHEMQAFHQPIEVYNYSSEIHTLDELPTIAENEELIRNQSLVIRQRILGESHVDVHYYLRYRGSIYCDAGDIQRCYKLWMYAFELQRKHFTPLHLSTVQTLVSFQETATSIIKRHLSELRSSFHFKYEWVRTVFDLICEELELVAEWEGEPLVNDFDSYSTMDGPLTTESETKKLAVSALRFAGVLETMQLTLPSIKVPDLPTGPVYLDIKRLINISSKLKLRLLHDLLEEEDRKRMEGDEEPLAVHDVLAQLLDNGVCPNQVDSRGNSPLHICLNAEYIRPERIRLFLDYGANVFACNNEGSVVYNMINEKVTEGKISKVHVKIGKYITLAGLAAHAISRTYRDVFQINECDFEPAQYRFLKQH